MMPGFSSSSASSEPGPVLQNVEGVDPLPGDDLTAPTCIEDPEVITKEESAKNKDVTQISGNATNKEKETMPIIEVKRPPTPTRPWDESLSTGTSMENALEKPSAKEESKKKISSDDKKISNRGDSGVEIGSIGDSKTKKPPSRDNSAIFNAKGLRSNIPRYSRNTIIDRTVGDKGNQAIEKRLFSGMSKIPKSSMNSYFTNQTRRSTPNRSVGSNMSSRAMSPVSTGLSSVAQNLRPTGGDRTLPGNQQKVEDLYSAATNRDGAIETKLDGTSTFMKRSFEKKPVNYLMPTKDGAGETVHRIPPRGDVAGKLSSSDSTLPSDIDLTTSRADLFRYLSEMNEQNQSNFKELRKLIKNESGSSKHAEIHFFKVEQLQMEIVQKLVKALAQFYEDREQLTEKFKNLSEKQEKFPKMEEKLALLEAENTNLLEKVKQLTTHLEDEKQTSQKRKALNQMLAQAKQKIQKAENRQTNIERKVTELSSLTKKVETSLKQKESAAELTTKKIKSAETTIQELEESNKKLVEELEEYRRNSDSKYIDLVQNSKELKDAKLELVTLQQRLNNEIEKRENNGTKLKETTAKLKLMEDKCKVMSELVNSAKDEVELLQDESSKIKNNLMGEINQLHTELKARKVLLKVAEDEVSQINNKLVKISIQAKQEHQKEKDASENEEQLKMELAIRDEQITQLQEQIKNLVEKTVNRENSKQKNKTNNKVGDKSSANTFADKVYLSAQMVDLERTVDMLAKDNLGLNEVIAQRDLELSQRDHILKMQTEVMKLRDELIWLLRSKNANHEDEIKRLGDVIQERESAISKEFNKALEAKSNAVIFETDTKKTTDLFGPKEESLYMSGTMYELYSSLEKKQMAMEKMQKKVQQLEGLQNIHNKQRTRLEARISTLEMVLSEKCHDSSGLVPILTQ